MDWCDKGSGRSAPLNAPPQLKDLGLWTRSCLKLGPVASRAAAGGSSAGSQGRAPSAELAAEAAEADEAEWACAVGGAWPFQGLCDQLCVDVLDATWEVRHGAATALREVLRSQASCAAVEAPVADEVSGWIVPGGTGERHASVYQKRQKILPIEVLWNQSGCAWRHSQAGCAAEEQAMRRMAGLCLEEQVRLSLEGQKLPLRCSMALASLRGGQLKH
eukprot:scaffold118152_cov19-Tisochrysis_lutea.AAC.2